MEKENENVTKEDIVKIDDSLVKTPASLDAFEKDSEEKSDSDDSLFCTQHHSIFEFFRVHRFSELFNATVCCHIRY